MKQDVLNVLQDNLGGAQKEFQISIADMCKRLENETELTQAELLKFIGNETAKCLSDYKTAIIEAFTVL